MIERLTEWVRNLIIIVIFANLIELLLPDSSMRKYIKVVMGFFILLTVLTPLLKILDLNLNSFYPFNDFNSKKDLYVADKGQELKKTNEELAMRTYQRQLEEQMKALILTHSEIEDTRINVQTDLRGKILGIEIRLKIYSGEKRENLPSKVTPIDRVDIQISSQDRIDKKPEEFTKTSAMQKIEEKIKRLLISFYNVKSETVRITWEE